MSQIDRVRARAYGGHVRCWAVDMPGTVPKSALGWEHPSHDARSWAFRDRRRIALGCALLVSFLAAAWIAAPLWIGLMLGTVMAFTAQPLHRFLERHLGGRRSLASAVTTLLGGVTMLSGGAACVYIVAQEAVSLIALAQHKLKGSSVSELLGGRTLHVLHALGFDRASLFEHLQSELSLLSSHAAEIVGLVLQTTAGALLTLVVALWTMYYALLEWQRLASKMELLLPLDPRDTRALILEFREVGRGAFVATVACAAIQALLAWIGFAIADVPQALVWSVLLGIVSFVPVIGTVLVWLPAAIYLMMIGHAGHAIFLMGWSALVVMAATDYVIRPRLVGRRGTSHPLLTLVSLIGGISVVGLPGLVVGPVIISLFVALVRIHERDGKDSIQAAL